MIWGYTPISGNLQMLEEWLQYLQPTCH
jgi:hypothetical protein